MDFYCQIFNQTVSYESNHKNMDFHYHMYLCEVTSFQFVCKKIKFKFNTNKSKKNNNLIKHIQQSKQIQAYYKQIQVITLEIFTLIMTSPQLIMHSK